MIVPNLQSYSSVDASLKGFLDALIGEMQKSLSNEGFEMPNQSTSNISTIQSGGSRNGTVIYDETTHQLKVNVNGVFKVIQVV